MAVADILELTARTSESFDNAIEIGIGKGAESVEDIQSAGVKDQQVMLSNANISAYQVTLKVTFIVR